MDASDRRPAAYALKVVRDDARGTVGLRMRVTEWIDGRFFEWGWVEVVASSSEYYRPAAQRDYRLKIGE